jgi:hypothetical protein
MTGNRDVVNGHFPDEPFESSRMPVAVEHEIGDVLGDGRREAVAAEEGEDSFRLALQGGRCRRVVEEDDAQRAVGNRL